MPGDIGLQYDPATRGCDIQFAAGDVVLDATARTPLILSIGCDRRAEPDDELPAGGVESPGIRFNPRRGWAGDALDAQGRRTGSRMWLIERAKQTEDTRAAAEAYLAEATDWLRDQLGLPVSVAARFPRRDVMTFAAVAGDASLSLSRAVG